MERSLMILKILVFILCLELNLVHSTGYYANVCWGMPNCQKCSEYDCVRCNIGYHRVARDVGHRCVRNCPRGQTCTLRFPACPYGVENCVRCTTSNSCEKCRPGYYGLREGETHSSPYRCVQTCPQGWVPKAVAGHGQRCKLTKFPPARQGCRRVGDCLECPGVTKCLRCNSGYKLQADLQNQDMSCVFQVAGVTCRVENGCLSCNDGRPLKCFKCKSGYRIELGADGQSVVCNPTGPQEPRRGCDYDSCVSTSHARCVMRNGKVMWSCSTRSDPACGSNGHTYSNACFLKLHTCGPDAPYVYLASRGACAAAGPTASNPCSPNPCRGPYAVCVNVRGSPACQCDRQCNKALNPICGSDGKTYSNECFMQKHSCLMDTRITVAYRGECRIVDPCVSKRCPPYGRCRAVNGRPICECNDICSRDVDGVCGSDGKTYDNECMLRAAACNTNTQIRVDSKGRCPADDPCLNFPCNVPYSRCVEVNGTATCRCIFSCSSEHRPVCGSDSVTYNNECTLKKQACETVTQITVASQGRCVDPCVARPCLAPYAVCRAVRDRADCSCQENCPRVNNPVCGSNYKTYRNKCLMELEACQSGTMITVRSRGRCPDPCVARPCRAPYAVCRAVRDRSDCSCQENCPRVNNPLCGSNYKTYRNKCLMELEACQSGTMITVRSRGRCPDPCVARPCRAPYAVCSAVRDRSDCSCQENCPRVNNPVCGSNYKTYRNKCLMELEACQSGAMITVRSRGRCPDPCVTTPCKAPYSICTADRDRRTCSCNTNCPSSIDRVCSSDFKTYANVCLMRLASCRSGTEITVRTRGRCVDPCVASPCKAPYSTCRPERGQAVCSCYTNCPTVFDLVCGSDFKTYNNRCLMELLSCRSGSRITVRSRGRCVDPCVATPCKAPYSTCRSERGRSICSCKSDCPRNVVPVCGSDYKTYNNRCLMELASCQTGVRITVRSQGRCADPCEVTPCRKPYSVCKAERNEATCICNTNCPRTVDPVCGSDYNTYNNDCLMRLAACRSNKVITVRSRGRCVDPCVARPCAAPYSTCRSVRQRAICSCNTDCPRTVDPVCGSDYKTYNNRCLMELASCQTGVRITVRSRGRCADPCVARPCAAPYSTCRSVRQRAICSCNTDCPRTVDPVCGSDYKTYNNRCLMELASCQTGVRVTVRSRGRCADPCVARPCAAPYSTCRSVRQRAICSCNTNCPRTVDIVCGSDYKTYNNRCLMELTSCQTGVRITVRSRGRCSDPCTTNSCKAPYSRCTAERGRALCSCKADCPRNIDLVCGSDFKTYDNRCLMELASCRTGKRITVRSQGRCVDPCDTSPCRIPYAICKAERNKATCICNTNCPRTVDPVCGSDYITYNNDCLMRLAACRSNKVITVRSRGRCVDPCVAKPCQAPYAACRAVRDRTICTCKSNCPRTLDLVCGSDYKTYDNRCLMELASCQTGVRITVRSRGRCVDPCSLNPCRQPFSTCVAVDGKAECRCPPPCIGIGRPICGSDYNTYNSECEMKQAACRAFSTINIAYDGPCLDPCSDKTCSAPYSVCSAEQGVGICGCNKACAGIRDPVCGSDFKTYQSECLMQLRACETNIAITVSSRGRCVDPCSPNPCKTPYAICKREQQKAVCSCNKDCPIVDNEVCGSDYKTYPNACKLKLQACVTGSLITIRYRRRCVDPCVATPCRRPFSTCRAVRGKAVCRCKNSCLATFNPVCGTDFKSYDNMCLMQLAACRSNTKITVRSQGNCPDPCATNPCKKPYEKCRAVRGKALCSCRMQCSRLVARVCGTDFRTYSNECFLKYESCRKNKLIAVSSPGACVDPCLRKPCKAPYALCRSSGAEAACSCPTCSSEFQPVCGSDGKTYNNICFMQLSACQSNVMIRDDYRGRCRDACAAKSCRAPYSYCVSERGRASCKCPNNCQGPTVPVCGSDFKTYRNLCSLKRTACRGNRMITLRSNGECRDPCFPNPCKTPYAKCSSSNGKAECRCNGRCPEAINRVCGSDYKTYNNECTMKFRSCRSNKMVTVVSRGRCSDPCQAFPCPAPHSVCRRDGNKRVCSCQTNCPSSVNQVCATDGRMYTNECWMRLRACQTSTLIAVRSRGPCRDPCDGNPCKAPYAICTSVDGRHVCRCDLNCPATVRYVCGSDGKTYDNECRLRRASCQSNTRITVSSAGQCRDLCQVNPCRQPYAQCRSQNGRRTCSCNSDCGGREDPVCGSDAKTYRNLCLMKYQSCQSGRLIVDSSRGSCKDPCDNLRACTDPYSSCSASNGRAVCTCPICPNTRDDVCGSDGKSYQSACLLQLESCRNRVVITVRSRGRCVVADPCAGFYCRRPYSLCKPINNRPGCACKSDNCPDTNQPVCGSDRKTYRNKCLMESISCRSGIMITVGSSGACAVPCASRPCDRPYAMCTDVNGRARCDCPKFCPRIYKPVCGSEGKTYGSVCLLKKKACEDNKMVTVTNSGECADACRGNPCASRPYSTCRAVNGTVICECRENCPNTRDPVCGSDRKTYSNECLMKLKACESKTNILVAYKGQCRNDPCAGNPCARHPYSTCRATNGKPVCHCRKSCPQDPDYVCGSDGKTYKTECLMIAVACESGQNISRSYKGLCRDRDLCAANPCARRPYSTCTVVNGRAMCECRKNCPRERVLVCGTDGNNYNNECLMQLRACETSRVIRKAYDGRCRDPCVGSPCASRPYSTCTVVNGRAVCECRKNCPRERVLVCGSDGNTYNNECLMQVRACETSKNIRKAYDGRCRGSNPCAVNPCAGRPYSICSVVGGQAVCRCNSVCAQDYSPVCGSDGKTYDNECRLRHAACTTRKRITVVSRGRCSDPIINLCDNNPCASRPYSRCRITNGRAGCTCVDDCSEEYRPVCGSNGKTYSNECFLRRTACRTNTMIAVRYSTACQACQLIDNCLVCPGQKPRKCAECPEGHLVELSSDGTTLICRRLRQDATVAPTVSCRFVDSCWVCAGSKKRKCAVCPSGYVAELKEDETHTIQCVSQTPRAHSVPAGCLDLTCRTCREGWYHLDQFNGQSCYRKCPKGYYPSGRVCARCPDGCEVCYTSKTCYKCKSNLARLYKAAQGVECVSKCPRNYRRELVKGTWVCTSSICDVENCNRCSGNPKLCDKCDTDFYKFFSVRTGEDHCLAYCPNGFRAKRAENGGFICAPGINYILQDKVLQNCDQTCESRNLECASVGHGFTNDNVIKLFRQLGVTCTTGFAESDHYKGTDNPCLIKKSARNEKWAGRCIGWKNIPPRIDCAATPPRPVIQRLCPCREKKISTSPPTEAPHTVATEPYITPVWTLNKL